MESPKSTTLPDVEILKQRVDILASASIAEMRRISFIPLPDDNHPKAVEFVMIVRNEFTKRLKFELENSSTMAVPALLRSNLYRALSLLRDEIEMMAKNENGWLEGQLEHVFPSSRQPNGVTDWADKYLDSMLISIGV